MIRAIKAYVGVVDAVNYRLGRVIMWGLFALMAILLWSSLSKTFFLPSFWTLEMAQFAMVAYYILGGPYALQMGANVRMDLFYGDWSPRRKAMIDTFTVLFLIFYLSVMLYGGLGSTAYSLGYWGDEPITYFTQLAVGVEEVGRLERSATAWRPYIWPIKSIMCFGLFLMILQSISELCKDILMLTGRNVETQT